MEREELAQYLSGTCGLVEIRGHYVIVELPPGLSTSERGRRLLGLEVSLRENVDPLAEVFLEPTGDLNKLRILLRGVKTDD